MTREAALLSVIHLQTEIAQQGLDLGGVMSLVVDRVLPLLDADGAATELLDGDEMVYRAVSGMAVHTLRQQHGRHAQAFGGALADIDGLKQVNDALCPVDGVDLPALLDLADARMYTVKRAHKRLVRDKSKDADAGH